MPRPTPAAFYRSLSKARSPSPSVSSPPPSPWTSPEASPSPNITFNRRQHDLRMKKTAELAKPKMKKGRFWSSKPSDPKASLDVSFEDDRTVQEEPEQAPGQPGNKFEYITRPNDRPEVQLADLLTMASRKPRRKGKDGDFEVIPPVRSVIVLDDNVTPELDFDEPWEHIYGAEDELTDQEPSYANIVSLN